LYIYQGRIMKRSEINDLIDEAIDFFKTKRFFLPPFAFYSLQEWQRIGRNAQEIFDLGLGWDVTDFGSDTFHSRGLMLFTLRNGLLNNKIYPKPYAEKIMVVGPDQVTPFHYHWDKIEDIINRGGGDLVFKFFESTENDEFDQRPVELQKDGIKTTLKAGEELCLKPGESVQLPTKLYHTFYGRTSTVMVGEVSMVNNDAQDNNFYGGLPRFSKIEEDVEPKYLLCNDYEKFLKL
jgi:D-lyxose ketol-isomerase